MKNIKLLLLGSGGMAADYTKVLKELKVDFQVLGNSVSGCQRFTQITGIQATPHLKDQIKHYSNVDYVVNCVSSHKLYEINKLLIKHKFKYVLTEKPGAFGSQQVNELATKSDSMGVKMFVAYNRRFYASVDKLVDLIKKESGVTSFHFNFTELVKTVLSHVNEKEVLENWFFVNSLHVIDLAFYLSGEPEFLDVNVSDRSYWHNPMIFSGSGRTKSKALFSYIADWTSAGRWGIEVNTKHNKYFLQPLEELRQMKKDSMKVEKLTLDNKLDIKFKPGLFNQLKAFLYNHKDERLIDINKHAYRTKNFYEKIVFGK